MKNAHALNYRDIAGQRFGRLTALSFEGTTDAGNALWRVRCDCGATFITAGSNLRAGRTLSCGCFRAERTAATNHARKGSTLKRATI